MQKRIINLFLYNKSLRFNEIEKQTKERSNKLAYSLANLVKKEILTKNKGEYSLSDNFEGMIPHITEKNSVLAIILVALTKKDKVFLIKRSKRPFNNDKW